MPPIWHVLVSHPPAEGDRAGLLARRLLEVGVAVALEEWTTDESSPGKATPRPEGTWSEAVLVSPVSLSETWAPFLAHRLLRGGVAGRRRLLPVVVGSVGEPSGPLKSRPWFRIPK